MLAYGHEWNREGQLPETLREVSLDCSRAELEELIAFLQNVREEAAGAKLDSLSHWHFRDWSPDWSEKHSDIVILLSDHHVRTKETD